MDKNTFYLIVSVLVLAILGAGGYLFYQKVTAEKSQLKQQLEEAKSKSSSGGAVLLSGPAGEPLPVTNDPGESNIPIYIGQPVPEAESAPAEQSPNQQNSEEQAKLNAEFLDISKWKPYTNDKYGYSFKFPKEFDYSPCDDKNPCQYGQVYEKDGGDTAWVMGDLNVKGWPNIVITHYENESFTLPKGKKLLDWVREKFNITDKKTLSDYNIELPTTKGNPKKGVRISLPQSPQAYAREEIYFENDGKIFQIQLMDSNKTPALEIYNAWLKTFVAE